MSKWIAIIWICGFLAGCGKNGEVTQPAPPTPPGDELEQPGDTTPPPADEPGPPARACVTTGCSGTLCVEEGNEVMTTCVHKPEFTCYKQAVCERQPSGECGWTQSQQLQSCIEQARAQSGSDVPQ